MTLTGECCSLHSFPTRRSSDLTTFVIGRKGTGKSTIFQRLQAELRKRKHQTSAYIDIKTVWESRSEEHTSELQSRRDLVCRLLLEKKNRPAAGHRRRLRPRCPH